MPKKNKLHCPTLKAKVAFAALKGERTTAQLASDFRIHPNLIYKWRKQLLEGASAVFEPSGHPGQG